MFLMWSMHSWISMRDMKFVAGQTFLSNFKESDTAIWYGMTTTLCEEIVLA